MQGKSLQNVKKILERLKLALNLTKDIELVEVLQVNHSTISVWKNRNSIDYELLFSICNINNINLNWIINGEGEPHLPQKINEFTISEPKVEYEVNKIKEIFIDLKNVESIIFKLK